MLRSILPVLAAAAVFASPVARAVPTYVPGTCIVDPNDPYEPNTRMSTGKVKGLCIDPTERRSVKILRGEEASRYFKDIAPSDIVLANFSHEKKFWIAKIPMASIQDMIIEVEYFPQPVPALIKKVYKKPISIAHTQFRFRFNAGAAVEIVPQTRQADASVVPARLDDLIFSVENIGPYGTAFDAFLGLRANYALAYRAVSLPEKERWMVVEQDHLVTQNRLKLSSAEASAILRAGLERGDHYGTGRPYNTIRPNCVSELFNIVDTVLGIHFRFDTFYTNSAVKDLRHRGLIDDSVKLPTMKEEYEASRK